MKRLALISVSDKRGLVPFARGLVALGFELVSTSGTYRLLRKGGLPVRELSKLTGFPEILGGRVKTLHPKVHGGILADRGRRSDLQTLKRLKISPIDLVVVNLYPFEAALRQGKGLSALVEEIDIGGVTLLRAAAKNFRSVGVVCRPEQYDGVLKDLRAGRGKLPEGVRQRLAVEAFQQTAAYDTMIQRGLAHRAGGKGSDEWPERLTFTFLRRQVLRYGENPHQRAAWYDRPVLGKSGGLGRSRQLSGKELSFNTLLDLEAAIRLVSAFRRPTATVIKHNNPCGVASAGRLPEAFRKAHAGDPISAFGGIVGLNRPVDGAAARAILKAGFLECVAAPRFTSEGARLLKVKKNLRLVEMPLIPPYRASDYQIKPVSGGLLVQESDRFRKGPAVWKRAAGPKPTAARQRDLLFAWTVARFVRSNAIVVVKGEQAVGIGGGQTSRVDAVRIALKQAGKKARGAVLASDGFFPKPDGPAAAVRAGIRAIVQPGGSVQDPAVVAVARRAGITMLLTGERHFQH